MVGTHAQTHRDDFMDCFRSGNNAHFFARNLEDRVEAIPNHKCNEIFSEANPQNTWTQRVQCLQKAANDTFPEKAVCNEYAEKAKILAN